MRVTLADVAREYLNFKNGLLPRGGKGNWMLDCGMLCDLHSIYDVWCHMNSVSPDRRAKVRWAGDGERYAVLRALALTKAGRRLFDCAVLPAVYPGIVNGPARLLTLKEGFREPGRASAAFDRALEVSYCPEIGRW